MKTGTKTLFLLPAFLLIIITMHPDARAAGPVVSYKIDARLHPKAGTLTATERLFWRNTSARQAGKLMFHLYYNAFLNEESSFLMEDGFYRKTPDQLRKYRFGGIKIVKITTSNGADLTGAMRFVSPDDGNRHDRTLLEVRLPRPVAPGSSITLHISFTLDIPKIISRTGSVDDYFFMAQWFPKIGVREKNGSWNCHQYHHSAEYFADFGSYDVSLTMPSRFIVGATGNLITQKKNSDNTVTRTYRENNIHDFAWTAWPRFIRITDSIQLPGNPAPTSIELLLAPQHTDARERHLDSLKYAMAWFAEKIYPYPYKKITLVDAPLKGMGSWGMEYPTLITSAHVSLAPECYKLPEEVTIHEFGHQYWYGMVGFDETREAWLDEGINTFFELVIMEDYFKDTPSYFDFDPFAIHDWEKRRQSYVSMKKADRVNTPSWKFLNHAAYRGNVYSQASMLLLSLRNLMGADEMYGFFRNFARANQFRHPKTHDFINAFNTYTGNKYNWAFEQFINGDAALDNSVYSVESVKVNNKAGKYRNEVVFLRDKGYFPVETLIVLRNGGEIRSRWTKQERWKRVVFHADEPVQMAAIDPEIKVPLDRDLLNNSMLCESRRSSFSGFYSKLGIIFQLIICTLLF